MTTPTDQAQWVAEEISLFTEKSPRNSLGTGEKAWDAPMVGFSAGDDPFYQWLKTDIGEFHFTPAEIFSLTFPRVTVSPSELRVISWILPQTKVTKTDNSRQRTFPAERWARSRIFGEEFNKALGDHLVEKLTEMGIEAVCPSASPHWSQQPSPRYGFASRWSERHAAYVSGLGTFGLCDGLITPLGKAIRCGSVVARMHLPVSVRPYDSPRGYCLHYTNGSCRSCIDRCPVGAITEAGHQKEACFQHVKSSAAYVRNTFGFEGYGCGLCQTAVPCASRVPDPMARQRKSSNEPAGAGPA